MRLMSVYTNTSGTIPFSTMMAAAASVLSGDSAFVNERIISERRDEHGSAASTVSAAALAASAPSVPGSVKGVATKVAGQIKVTWKAGSLNGAPSATYKVSWLVGGKWTTPVMATGFAYTISKLKPGTYSVKVTATTSQGSASATKAGIVLKK
jgi:hypothetical protein